ncbi:MAG: ATP-binding protein [Firmicutes bacterium]|nr:ATP-binding protein [Bacillota bacterium]
MPLGKRIFPPKEPENPQNQSQHFVENAENAANAENAENPKQEEKPPQFTLLQAEPPKHTFDDIILNKETLDNIQDVLALYENRELLFNTWGLGERYKDQNKAGVNLYGHSGTGKTMAAHAIASQLNRQILTVDYSQIESKYVGETSKNLAAMFQHAKQSQAIIFFDESDALLSRRVTNMSNSTDVSVNQTRSVLLMLINDFDDMIIFATNFISNYDPAFMRRILAHIKFDLPNEENRQKLWELYVPKALPTDINTAKMAKYDNVSGSDISNAVLKASLRAVRSHDTLVFHEYFEDAIERIIESKTDNDDLGTLVSKRTVSKEYVEQQLGGLPK